MVEFVTSLQAIATADSTLQLEIVFKDCVARRGFPFTTFLRYCGASRGTPVWLSLPKSFIDAYKANGWREIDPGLLRARGGERVILWDDIDVERLPRGQREIVDLKRSFGIFTGVTIAFHLAAGSEFDCISVARDEPGKIQRDVLAEVYALASQAWMRYSVLLERSEAQGAGGERLPSGGIHDTHAVSTSHLRLLFMIDLATRHGGFGVDDMMDRVYQSRWKPEMVQLLTWGWVSEKPNDEEQKYELKLTPLGYAAIDQCPNPQLFRRSIARETLGSCS